MIKIALNKLRPADLATLNDAICLYSQYLTFFSLTEPGQNAFIYKSIAVELEYVMAGRLKVRRVPQASLLNLEIHQGFILQNSLQHYIGHTRNDLERARSYRLLERINKMLPSIAEANQ